MRKAKTIVERLDDLAFLTGIPQRSESIFLRRRRPMRWLPLAALIAATVVCAVMVASPGMEGIYVGLLSPLLGWGSTFALKGPPYPWGWGGHVLIDERDRVERSRAYLFAFAVAFVIGVIALLCLGGAALMTDIARERLGYLIIGCVMYQIILLETLPTLYASWTPIPLPPAEDDDVTPAPLAMKIPRLGEQGNLDAL